MNLTQADLMKLALALGVCYAAFRFSGSQMVKTAAVSVGAVIVARKLPYVGDALA